MRDPVDRISYFSRQAAIAEIGQAGIASLGEADVAVVGCGGVGSAAANYLARSGVGHLRLIDQDVVTPSSLSRNHCVTSEDLYRPKAEAVADQLAHSHPWLKTEVVVDTLRPSNIDEFLQETDVIVDGLDNFQVRYLLNHYSVENKTPYLFTSAIKNQAHAALFTPPETGCLQCTLPGVVSRTEESCESLGVTTAIVGLTGTLAANETIRFLLGRQGGLRGVLLTVDLDGPEFVSSKLVKRENCEECGTRRSQAPNSHDWNTVMLCGENSVSISPHAPRQVDLKEAALRISEDNLLRISAQALVFRLGSQYVTLFQNGRLTIHGVKTVDEARMAASQTWELLDLSNKSQV